MISDTMIYLARQSLGNVDLSLQFLFKDTNMPHENRRHPDGADGESAV